MQSIFGHFLQRYVHSVVPCRPCYSATLQTIPKSRDLPDGLYEEEYSCNPPALAMIIISTIEIFFFLYDLHTDSRPVEGPMANLFIYNPHRRYQAWRYLTYMFVHVG